MQVLTLEKEKIRELERFLLPLMLKADGMIKRHSVLQLSLYCLYKKNLLPHYNFTIEDSWGPIDPDIKLALNYLCGPIEFFLKHGENGKSIFGIYKLKSSAKSLAEFYQDQIIENDMKNITDTDDLLEKIAGHIKKVPTDSLHKWKTDLFRDLKIE